MTYVSLTAFTTNPVPLKLLLHEDSKLVLHGMLSIKITEYVEVEKIHCIDVDVSRIGYVN